ncbi:hypothetical protein Pla110_07220 [Polystyrenella longa]|uniref:DUF4314 domain-containing protein n=1 Tax=Polystyrenella longa TaxID=2528007 RepID=A0A518CIG0_9PLAN|nr:hypothetical protein [Polystyrenella longa]QDU79018.1 hypothetical protein Pla110_07220 [Polystyrenella longa]
MAGKTLTKLTAGTKVRVKDGTPLPEFPDTDCGGWTGEIMEHIGKKSSPRYVLQWDDNTVAQFDEEYIAQCEEKKLFHLMACFEAEELEVAE